jgi:uncharacterized protein YfbU (UPF0304 family)
MLAEFLESEGHETWWDHKLKGGERFVAEIVRQIESAEKVLVVWSRESAASDYVLDEANRGRTKLVPVRIDDVELPLGFGMIHTIDLRDWPKRLEEVLAAVGGAALEKKSATMASKRKHSLSKVERLLLINQYQILSLLQPQQAQDHQLMIKKLENGYTPRLFVFGEYLGDDLSDSVDHFVFEVLEMYRAMTFSLNGFKKKDGLDKKAIQFPGFDGNYETEYLVYAQYLLDDEKLYAELQRKGGYNSHHPTIERYGRMIAVWKQSAAPRLLTADDITRIIAA